MKKIFCLILCFVMLIGASSCSLFSSKSDTEETLATTSKRKQYITREEVEKYVTKGEIPEMEYGLGGEINAIKKYYKGLAYPTTKKGQTTTEVDDPPFYDYHEGIDLTSVSYDSQRYFFMNMKPSYGVAILTCSNVAFNFQAGNCYIEDVVYSLGKPDVQDVPTSDQMFYILGSPQSPERLTYIFGEKRLDFIFDNDNLVMTVLTDTTLYDGFVECTTAAQSTVSATSSVEQ